MLIIYFYNISLCYDIYQNYDDIRVFTMENL